MDPAGPIILSPTASLIFEDHAGDWRERLFDLSASRQPLSEASHKFWRSLADELLTIISRLPDEADLEAALAKLPQEKLEAFTAEAPPMAGGEYLSFFSLSLIWHQLSQWVAQAAAPSLSAFLLERAPLWKRVGRVTFHLAENKSRADKPFAFLVTYVNSLNSEGRDQHIPLGKALKLHDGQENHPQLLSLMAPVKAAAQRLPWVAKMVANKDIYSGLAFSIEKAHRFLRDVPVLEECGLMVRIPDWWKKRQQVKVQVKVDGTRKQNFGLDQLLTWDVELAIGDLELTKGEINELLSSNNDGLIFFKGQWLEVDRDKLNQALEQWKIAASQGCGSGLSFIQAMRLLAGFPAQDHRKNDLPEPDEWVLPKSGPILEEILNELKNPQASEPPEELKATLRPYQKEGLTWLATLSALGLGACLADDMGLGKTMQVLALLLLQKKRNPQIGPSLLVAPASLMANWRLEAEKYAPSLRLTTWHQSETSLSTRSLWNNFPALLEKYDLIITSYGVASGNLLTLQKTHWNLIILDEAQAIKNPSTLQSQAVKKLKGNVRIALTGTPIENRLIDLWSLFDFLNPGLLGSLQKFQSITSRLALSDSPDRYKPIKGLVGPYLLRRMKSDKRIINDLPDKTEVTLYCNLTKDQAKLYDGVVNQLKDSLLNLNGPKNNIVRSALVIQSLTRLKQILNHPAQLTGDMDWNPERSGKFLRLAELCQEMADRQERILVFTQYKEIIEPLANHLASIFGAPGLILHGSTKVTQRQKLVQSFQDPNGPPFFVLSLKAGGTGLNLTAAGQVIHFDRWWNPAVEDQATDRAYRIGQKKNVLVHKCVTIGTMEEKIDNLLKEKRNLASDLLDNNGQYNVVTLDNESLLRLVSLDIDKALMS
jgi:non-specific serine/threonine protein kinase